MEPTAPADDSSWFSRFFIGMGLKALAVAAVMLFLLKGLDPGAIALFGIPPLLAMSLTRPNRAPNVRCIAWSFLVAIGVGSVVASFPEVFPKLGGVAPELGPQYDRLLTWYGTVYLFWILGVIPFTAFRESLRASREGSPAVLSRTTCRLGLFAIGLLCFGLPGLLNLLGFWPLY